jgi:hypothetical protein
VFSGGLIDMRRANIAVILAVVCGDNVEADDQISLVGSTLWRPNIIFMLTDDQDVHLDSLKFMPFVRQHLLDQGTYFNKHYCTTAVCCPSRATLWTGKSAHNTNITDVNPPYGMGEFALSTFSANMLIFGRWLSKVRRSGLQSAVSTSMVARSWL